MNSPNGHADDMPLDPKMETAVFGREAEYFIENDPIGQYIINQAQSDLQQASEGLLEVDPHDFQKIAQLQLDARVANRVRGWLKQAIENGKNAALLIQEERDTNGT